MVVCLYSTLLHDSSCHVFMFMLHNFMWNLHESSPFRACLPFKTFQAATLEEQEHIRLEIGDKVHQVDQIIHVPGVV